MVAPPTEEFFHDSPRRFLEVAAGDGAGNPLDVTVATSQFVEADGTTRPAGVEMRVGEMTVDLTPAEVLTLVRNLVEAAHVTEPST